MSVIDLLLMSLSALVANKLRSVLTLVGIVAGVASIIAVMTAIAVVQSTMEREMSVLGSQVFQVQKWPAGGFHSDQERRRAMRRPPLTLENANAIRDQVGSVDLVGSELWDFGYVVEYRDEETNPNVAICGGTPEYPANNTHYVGLGRNLSQMDVKSGRNVAVIGHAIGQKLFPFTDPIGAEIRLDGRKYEVIGVFDEKKSAFGSGYDNYVLIPVTTFLDIYGMTSRDGFSRSVNITVRARSPELVRDAIEETRQVLRRERGVKPHEEDNFDFFNSESLITRFNQTTAKVKIAAFVIGIVALVVAGIGIMNIMLVSVTERTKEIGIRKSLGAKPGNILLQFLLEAVILCNIGGIVGILVGFALGNVVTAFTSFAIQVPVEWAFIGLVFCSTIGIAFGLLPAIRAARLNPIDALRYE
ncbi:MAG TPA: ABC transporter permease [Candidatus Krumholzibacteria bacterium]|nr:ABC transporter permease [Candidatus Krumholzibacteria bacterium]HPD73116.1 ABC transporter permease [Candidatus Krumholzibacteria bacterium]HRY41916.1 ABC transporter permease [Candidatus Krumholzibacteria bacterium]